MARTEKGHERRDSGFFKKFLLSRTVHGGLLCCASPIFAIFSRAGRFIFLSRAGLGEFLSRAGCGVYLRKWQFSVAPYPYVAQVSMVF